MLIRTLISYKRPPNPFYSTKFACGLTVRTQIFCIGIDAFDAAEACELFGILLLWSLRFIFHINFTGFYRDDGIIILRKVVSQKTDRLRKSLITFFKEYGLSITTPTNAKLINFLDVNLELTNE